MKHIEDKRKDQVIETVLLGNKLEFRTTWGTFSPKQIDAGSKMLLDSIDLDDVHSVLDIGCGYGPLGLAIAKTDSFMEVHMVDRDFIAVEYATFNAKLNGTQNAKAYLSNGFSHVPADMKFDVIVSNLPAKVGNEMFEILFEDAKEHLNTGGRLYVVTISGLKEYIKRTFKEIFGNYEKIKQGGTYTVAVATKE